MQRRNCVLVATALVVAACGTTTPDDATTPTSVVTTPAPTTPAPTTPAVPDTPSPTPTPTPTPTAAPTPTARDAATPFPANTEEDTGDPSGDPGTVADVRVGRHDGYDRVVFDADGGGVPGWRVGYVDQANEHGSGDEVEVAGNAILQVTLTNTAYPFSTDVEEFAQDRVDGAEVVTEVVYNGVYEGQTQAFIGVTGQHPFRARALDEGRVLVEVWHEQG